MNSSINFATGKFILIFISNNRNDETVRRSLDVQCTFLVYYELVRRRRKRRHYVLLNSECILVAVVNKMITPGTCPIQFGPTPDFF